MITEHDVEQAQKQWGSAIVRIGSLVEDQDRCRQEACEVLQQLYAFEESTGCLFKPTKARDVPFRNTYAAALSYFVGEDPNFPEDHGFARNPWKSVRFKNSGFLLFEETSLAMGHYWFQDNAGEEIRVEYTFGYLRNRFNQMKISLHHSSLPFS